MILCNKFSVKVFFIESEYDRSANIDGLSVNIIINSKLSLPTQYLSLITSIIHEYTHISRIMLNRYKNPKYSQNTFYNYFLSPEEMIAYYNMILVESIMRKCSFENMLKHYVDTEIIPRTNLNVGARFTKGIIKIKLKKKTLWYNEIMNKQELNNRLEEARLMFDEHVKSLGKYATMQISPMDRDSYVAEKMRKIEIMHKNVIEEIYKNYE